MKFDFIFLVCVSTGLVFSSCKLTSPNMATNSEIVPAVSNVPKACVFLEKILIEKSKDGITKNPETNIKVFKNFLEDNPNFATSHKEVLKTAIKATDNQFVYCTWNPKDSYWQQTRMVRVQGYIALYSTKLALKTRLSQFDPNLSPNVITAAINSSDPKTKKLYQKLDKLFGENSSTGVYSQ